MAVILLLYIAAFVQELFAPFVSEDELTWQRHFGVTVVSSPFLSLYVQQPFAYKILQMLICLVCIFSSV